MRVLNKRLLKWTLIVLAVLLVAIQAIRPAKTNPPVDESKTLQATTQVAPEVGAILERSCNDCHSSRTAWPWYSHVAPISWYLIRHVNRGRRELSFSDWGTYAPKRALRKLQEICEQVERDEMPMSSYVILHPSAKLSDADKQTLCAWTKQESARLLAAQSANQQQQQPGTPPQPTPQTPQPGNQTQQTPRPQ
ncbi:MAG TPA: heme-binding domain-containing protein [Pyrinomonadaceae bacterium]|jgi:hypothetical protein